MPRRVARRGAPPRPRWLLLGAVLGVTACSSGDPRPSTPPSDVAAACPQPTTAIGLAVGRFIEQTQPKPRRFLAATDAMLPDFGMRELQDRGPTYFYPPVPAQQAIVRDRLTDVGPWPALLVRFHGLSTPSGDRAVVTLSGQWVLGELDGDEVQRTEIRLACTTGRWLVDGATPLRSA